MRLHISDKNMQVVFIIRRRVYMKKYLLLFLIFMATFLTIYGNANAEQQAITLKQGFNFISFTLNPDVNAAGLKQQNSVIADIYLYSAAAGSFLSTFDGSLVSLSAGKGYIIQANAAAAITVNGTTPSSIGNITLKAGFNLMGISKTINSVKFSELIMNNSSVKGVYKWNSASGSFVSVLKNGNSTLFLDGVDPFLSSGQSYFIYIDSDSSFNCDNGYISFNAATSADEEAIRNIYSQFVTGIKTKNVTTIMSLYSDNYLHLGGDGVETKADRQARYTSVNYSSAEGTNWYVVSMKVSASSALVSHHCKTVLDGTVMEDETYNNDGACYLAKENGKWVIVGNQKKWNVSGFTAHFPNNYFVEVYVDDPQHKMTSVTLSGPGVTNSSMIYGFYSHMPTRWAPNPMPSFGASKPSTSLVYTFTIVSDGSTYTETLDLGNSFIDEAPEIIAPADGATLSSKPSFQWKPVSFAGAVYHVEIVDQNYKNIWNGDGDKTATSSEYSGTLSPGTYKWLVATKKSGSENVSFTNYRTFKVQ